ncbi:MAG: hypothetical protein Fur0022_24850 [Anaerolineales bacterium]
MTTPPNPDPETASVELPDLNAPPAGRGESPVDWHLRQDNFVRRMLNFFERLTLAGESLVSRGVRRPEFNPLYHTGTLTVFLLLIILVTGVYLTLFYQFGFEVSYQAVEKIEASLIGRTMRALHRYASGAAIITTLLHGWRTFFMDRFRGPRWLAWVSGVGMAVFLWGAGVTGYWLIWDERATILNQTLFRVLEHFRAGISFALNLVVTDNAGTGWIFMVVLITFHLGLSALMGGLLWYHLKRLSRPKWLPPRYWMGITLGLLGLAALLLPVGMAPRADGTFLPGPVSVDSWFLFYLPAALNWPPLLFWGGVLILIAGVGALPWLLVQKPLPIAVDATRCTGCTLCEADCPYQAIKMVTRPNGVHKYLAVVDPQLCVACGVCVGSCPPLALSLHGRPPEAMWQETVARIAHNRPAKVVFTCERHAFQGAKPWIETPEASSALHVIPLTCIGMAHPDLAARALEAGAKEVQFIGCPLEDCANREGNVWLEQRLARQRKPKLRLAYANAPIATAWVAPNEFAKAAHAKEPEKGKATAYGFALTRANWSAMLPGLVLLGVALAGQIWLSEVPFLPFPADQAMIEIALDHKSGYPLRELPQPAQPAAPDLDAPVRLILTLDGETLLDKTYLPGGASPARAALIFEQVNIPAGTHEITLEMFDQPTQTRPIVLFADTLTLDKGQELSLHFTDGQIDGDPVRGEQLYYEMALGENVSCRVCHALEANVVLVGPSFAGIGTAAGERIPGMSAEDYLRQSILEPDAYKVPGFEDRQMLQNFGEILTKEQIDDLVAFLLTLK